MAWRPSPRGGSVFVIPISHEDQQVQRLPWVTIGLIVVNFVVLLITNPIVGRETDEVRARSREVARFAREHPYLRFPEGLADVIPAEQPPADLPAEVLAEQQDRLDRLFAGLRETASRSLFRAYGYVPARPNLLALITSMFLHGGWLHLIGNMLFLWLAGPSLEDRWGRIFFVILYLASGIVATSAHVALQPRGTIPVVGASGAIAGLMGAFLVRLGATRIRFFYWLFFFRIFTGTFYARAYVVLPFWLLEQFAMAFGGEESGVAVWAHIGGFGLGVGVALVLRMTDLEAKFLAPAIEKKTTWTPSDRLAAALGKLDRGDPEGAIRDLEALSRTRPDDVDTRMALVSAHAAKGDRAAAGRESAKIVAQHLRARNMDGALAAFREHDAAYHEVPLPIGDLLALAGHCEKAQEYQEAGELYRDAMAAWPDDPLAPKALLGYGRLRLQVFKRPEDAVDLLERARTHPQATPEVQRTASEMLAAARATLRPPWQGQATAPEPDSAFPIPQSAFDRAAPPPQAPPPEASIPAEPAEAAPAIPEGGRFVPILMRAVGIDARGLHLQDGQGRTGLLAWQRVSAIAVGKVEDPEAADRIADRLILDILTAPRSTPAGAEFRSVRLSPQDLAIPQLQGEPSPVRALQRLVATILKATGATAHPSREACLSLQGLAPFSNLAAYEADLVARLTAG